LKKPALNEIENPIKIGASNFAENEFFTKIASKRIFLTAMITNCESRVGNLVLKISLLRDPL
jgi:hypothetical protein